MNTSQSSQKATPLSQKATPSTPGATPLSTSATPPTLSATPLTLSASTPTLSASTLARTFGLELINVRTYAMAGLFVLGNIALPQMAHSIPGGGPMLLPIYFFTLIAAYRYGLATGLVTALASPLINHLLFGMPMLAMLPVLLTKSTLLAVAAAWVSHRWQARISIALLALVVVAYQLPGSLAEYFITGSWTMALQDFRIGIPGMLLQVFGGWAVLKLMMRKR